MKTLFSYAAVVFILLGITACSAKIEPVNFKSPGGTRTVEVKGSQKVPGDPIDVVVIMHTVSVTDSIKTSFQASALTPENVSMEWKGEEMATLALKMADGDSKLIEMVLLDSEIKAIILPPKNAFPQ